MGAVRWRAFFSRHATRNFTRHTSRGGRGSVDPRKNCTGDGSDSRQNRTCRRLAPRRAISKSRAAGRAFALPRRAAYPPHSAPARTRVARRRDVRRGGQTPRGARALREGAREPRGHPGPGHRRGRRAALSRGHARGARGRLGVGRRRRRRSARGGPGATRAVDAREGGDADDAVPRRDARRRGREAAALADAPDALARPDGQHPRGVGRGREGPPRERRRADGDGAPGGLARRREAPRRHCGVRPAARGVAQDPRHRRRWGDVLPRRAPAPDRRAGAREPRLRERGRPGGAGVPQGRPAHALRRGESPGGPKPRRDDPGGGVGERPPRRRERARARREPPRALQVSRQRRLRREPRGGGDDPGRGPKNDAGNNRLLREGFEPRRRGRRRTVRRGNRRGSLPDGRFASSRIVRVRARRRRGGPRG